MMSKNPISGRCCLAGLIVLTWLAACAEEVSEAPRWIITVGPQMPSVLALDNDGLALSLTGTYYTQKLGAFDKNGVITKELPALAFVAVGPDGTLLSDTGTYLRAFDSEGEPRWAADYLGKLAVGPDGVVYSFGSPYGQHEEGFSKLAAISPQGELLWVRAVEGAADNAPAVTGDGRIVVIAVRGSLYSDLISWDLHGTKLWTAPVPGPLGSPAVAADGTVYQGTGSGLKAFAPDGTLSWTAPVGSVGSMVIGKKGRIFAIAGNKTVAISPDGEELWKYSGHQPSGLAVGSDGRVYAPGVSTTGATSDLAMIFAFNPGGKVHRKYDFTEHSGYDGYPLLAPGGYLYATSYIFVIEYNPDAIGGASAVQGYTGYLEAYDTEASKGLLNSSWPAPNGSAGNERCGKPVVAEPRVELLPGLWSRQDGDETHAFQLADSLPDDEVLSGESSPYVAWEYPADSAPVIVERGTWSFDDSTLIFDVLEEGGKAGSGTHTSDVGKSSPWELVVEDPVDRGGKATFSRIHQLPGPPSPSQSWGKTLATYAEGTNGDNGGLQIALAENGDMIVAGYFMYIARFTGGAYPALGNRDLWVGRLHDGDWEWFFYFGDDSDIEDVHGIAVLEDDTTVLAGIFPDEEGGEAHLMGISPQGERSWYRDLGDGERARRVLSMDRTSDGGFVLAGEIAPAGQTLKQGVDGSPFLTRLDPDFNVVWDRTWDAPGRQWFHDVAIGPDGAAVVVGPVAGTLDLGAGPLEGITREPPHYDLPKLLIATFDESGEVRWSEAFSGLGLNPGAAVDVAPDGSIVVAGALQESLDFGLELLTVEGYPEGQQYDAFVAGLEPDGTPVWSMRLGSPSEPVSFGDMAVDAGGNIALGIQASGKLNIRGEIIETFSEGHFLLQLDSCGQFLWAKDVRQGFLGIRGLSILDDAGIAFTGSGGSGYVESSDGAYDWTNSPQSKSIGILTWGFFAGVIQGAGVTNLPEGGNLPDCNEVFGDPTVALSFVGQGSGTVTSEPGGMQCMVDCSPSFPKGTTVTLTAEPEKGSHFAGWEGTACSGIGSCELNMNTSGSVTARFEVPGVQWAHVLGGEAKAAFNSITAAGDGSIYAAASKGLADDVDFGTGPQATGSQDGVLAAYEPDGTPRWVRILGGAGKEEAGAIASWPSGDVVVIGETNSPEFDAGGPPLAGEGNHLFVARYASSGEPVWVRRYTGVKGNSEGFIPLAGQDGSITLVGHLGAGQGMNFGTEADPVPGGHATRLDQDGNALWGLTISGGLLDGGAAGPDGSFYVSGQRSSGPFEFYVGDEEFDVPVGPFLARIGPDASLVWLHAPDAGASVFPTLGSGSSGNLVAVFDQGTGIAGATIGVPGRGLVVALNPAGQPVWLDHFIDDAEWLMPAGVGMTDDGAVVLACMVGWQGPSDLTLNGTGTVTVEDDVLFNAWSPGGELSKQTVLGLADEPDAGTMVDVYLAVTPDGGQVLGGGFSGDIHLGTNLSATAETSAFLIRYDL